MDVACGVLKKFDSFIANCYAHLNTYNSKHIPDITLLKVSKLYICNKKNHLPLINLSFFISENV